MQKKNGFVIKMCVLTDIKKRKKKKKEKKKDIIYPDVL